MAPTFFRELLLLLPATWALAGAAVAAPAHYVVFEIDAAGTAVPVLHRRVTLPEPPSGAPAERLLKARALPRRGDGIVWVETRLASGVTGYLDAVAVDGEIRGEFHGRPLANGAFEIDSHRLALERPAFVLRIPATEAGTVLELSGAAEARIDLDDLERRSRRLPLAHLAGAGEATTRDKASSANRADFLIMGDGYTPAQRDRFDADANRLTNHFFSITPYREYRSHTKVTRLFTASAQSGADHPSYQPGCNSSDCCSDVEAQRDPAAGRFVDTAFDATYCTGNIHRLLTVGVSKVLAAASAVPGWDRILMLVNDPVYGGSGGFVPVASLHQLATELMQHEFGHSFTGLADEYETPAPGWSRCSDATGSCEANVTDVRQRHQIKWAPWIAGSTPIPTPEGSGHRNDVGLFEGARYFSTGQYRPRDSCAMRDLGASFGEVCAQEYVLRLFRGGFGTPAGGIDPIEPGSERPRPGTVEGGSEPLTLSVDLLHPSAGPPVRGEWWVDGQPVPGATGSSFIFAPEQDGTYRVELHVDASTPLVHPAMAGGALTSSRTWTVRAGEIKPPLVAAFEWHGDRAGSEIAFTDASAGEPQSWLWDFGDGTGSSAASPGHVFAAPGLYPVRLTVSRDGETASESRTVDVYATGPGPCSETPTSLCLQAAGRFKVEALWRDFQGGTGAAQVVPFASPDSGLLQFFGADNWELLVKVIDGCGFNQRYWVFAAATTNVEYTLRVRDSESGEVVKYFNPLGVASPAITDTEALAVCP